MEIDRTKTVEVYKNLHKQMWSVRQGGKVLEHCETIMLRDCRFVVQPAGRAKVLRERKKNVHAFIRGYVSSIATANAEYTTSRVVTYNPYKYPHFYCKEDERKIASADYVDLDCSEDMQGMEVVAILCLNLSPQWS